MRYKILNKILSLIIVIIFVPGSAGFYADCQSAQNWLRPRTALQAVTSSEIAKDLEKTRELPVAPEVREIKHILTKFQGPQEQKKALIQLAYSRMAGGTKAKIEELFFAFHAEGIFSELWRFFDGVFLSRQAENGADSFSDYLSFIAGNSSKSMEERGLFFREIYYALNRIPGYTRESTQFLRFNKDKRAVQEFMQRLISFKIGSGDYSIRAKSIGISSGEEPYSIAMYIYYALKEYYERETGVINTIREQKRFEDEWLSLWDIVIEAYDRDLMALALTQNGRFDFKYDDPISVSDYNTEYDDPWIIDLQGRIGEVWQKQEGPAEGVDFSFRENALRLLPFAQARFYMPFKARDFIKRWIKPIYADIKSPRDMGIVIQDKASIVVAEYLKGSIRVDDEDSYIGNILREQALDSRYPAYIAITDVDIIEPENLKASSAGVEKTAKDNIRAMYDAVKFSEGPDIIIVVSPYEKEQKFWKNRLESVKGQAIGKDTEIISICETYGAGTPAGNGLGSLLAYKSAVEESKRQTGLEWHRLFDRIRKEKSREPVIAIYHTAGLGRRVWPIVGSESGSKSRMGMPRMLRVGKRYVPMTLLEAVIFQTSIFAKNRAGRVMVFWGDQVFIPTVPLGDLCEPVKSPVEILAQVGDFKFEELIRRYGLIALKNEDGKWFAVQHMEKPQSVPIAEDFIRTHSNENVVGKSLGSFTVDFKFWELLMRAWKPELSTADPVVQAVSAADTDRDWWMPLTELEFLLNKARGQGKVFSSAHDVIVYLDKIGVSRDKIPSRIVSIYMNYRSQSTENLMHVINIGKDSFWWDFGTIEKEEGLSKGLYRRNILVLLENSSEGRIARLFWDIDKPLSGPLPGTGIMTHNSIVVNPQLDSRSHGLIRDSVIINPRGYINFESVEESYVYQPVSIKGKKVTLNASRAIGYKLSLEHDMQLPPYNVSAGLRHPVLGTLVLATTEMADPENVWNIAQPGNPMSFKNLSDMLRILTREPVIAGIKISSIRPKGFFTEAGKEYPVFEGKDESGNNVVIVMGLSTPEELPLDFIKGISRPKRLREHEPVTLAMYDYAKDAMVLYYEEVPQKKIEEMLSLNMTSKQVVNTKPSDDTVVVFSDRHGNLLLPQVLGKLIEREIRGNYRTFILGDDTARGPAVLVTEKQIMGNHDAWALGAALEASLYSMENKFRKEDYLFLLGELWHAFRYGTEEEFKARHGINIKHFVEWANQVFKQENLYADAYKKSPPLLTPRGPKTPAELAALILYLKVSCNRAVLEDKAGLPDEYLRTLEDIRAIPREYLELLGPDNASWPEDISKAGRNLLLGWPKRAEDIVQDMLNQIIHPEKTAALPAAFENARKILSNNFYNTFTIKRQGREINLLALHTLPPMSEDGIFKKVYIDGENYAGFEFLVKAQSKLEQLRRLYTKWFSGKQLTPEEAQEYRWLVKHFLPMVSLGRYSLLTAQDENRDGSSFPSVGTRKGSYEELRNIAYALVGVNIKRELTSSSELTKNLKQVYGVTDITDPREIARKTGDFLVKDASRALDKNIDIILGGHVGKTGAYADGRIILIDPEWAKKGGVGSFNDKGAALVINPQGRFFIARPYKVGRLLSYGDELNAIAKYIGLKEIRHYSLSVPWQSLKLYPKIKNELIAMLGLPKNSSPVLIRSALEQIMERHGQVDSLNEYALDELYDLYRYGGCEFPDQEAFRKSMAEAIFGGHPIRIILPAVHISEIDFPDTVLPFWRGPYYDNDSLSGIIKELHSIGIDINIADSYLHDMNDDKRILECIQHNTLVQEPDIIHNIFKSRLKIGGKLASGERLNEKEQGLIRLFETLFTKKHPVLMAQKGKTINIGIARGGRGGAAFTSRLNNLAQRLKKQGISLVLYVIPGATDFGRSWNFPVMFFHEAGKRLKQAESPSLDELVSAASDAIGIPENQTKEIVTGIRDTGLFTGIPDYYKALLDLGTKKSIMDILSWRIPGLEFKGQLRVENMNRVDVCKEMERFFTQSVWYGGHLGYEHFPILSAQRPGDTRLWQMLEDVDKDNIASRDEVLRLLKNFYFIVKITEHILSDDKHFNSFDWRAIPIRSLAAIALRIESVSWQESLDKAAQLLGVKAGRVMVTTEKRKAAIGIAEGGEILPDEDTFNEAAKVYDTEYGLYQHLALLDGPLAPNQLEQLRHMSVKEKKDFLHSIQQGSKQDVSKGTLDIIRNLDMLVFLPTTFMSNIGTMAGIKEISDAIAASKAFKIFWSNSTTENDYLMSAQRYVLLYYATATQQLGRPIKEWDMSRLKDFVNLLFTNGSKLHPYEHNYIPEGELSSINQSGVVSLSTNIEDPNPEDPEGKYQPDRMLEMVLTAYELELLGYELFMTPQGLVSLRFKDKGFLDTVLPFEGRSSSAGTSGDDLDRMDIAMPESLAVKKISDIHLAINSAA